MPQSDKPLAEAIEVALPTPCFDRYSLAGDIEEWLERDAVDARLRVMVRGGRDASFVMTLGDEPPFRRAFGELPGDCKAERRALALSIALAIDAIAPATEARTDRPRWAVDADAVLLTPLPDKVALGGAVSARFAATRVFWPEVGVIGAISSGNRLRPDLPVEYDASIVALRAGACGAWPLSPRMTAGGCAGPWLGVRTTRATELASARTESETWAAVAGTAELRARLHDWFGVHLAVDGVASLGRGSVRVADATGKTIATRDLPSVFGAFRLGACASF